MSASTSETGRSFPKALKPWRTPFLPAAGAIVFALASLTPSLLPRPAPFQGVVTAVAALAGYGVGALLGWAVRSTGMALTGRVRWLAWRLLALAAGVGGVAALGWYVSWQRELRTMIGADRLGWFHVPLLVVIAAALFVVLLVVGRALRSFGRVTIRFIGRLLPAPLAGVLGTLLVLALAWVLVTEIAAGRIVDRLDSTFADINHEFSTDVPAPTSPELSAGPGSLVSWDDLGRQGRVFIDNAPTAAQISAVSGTEAMQPVRAYVGVGTDGDIDLREEARIAVAELERTGGLQRRVVNVATGTGRGWINENSARALEFMYGGDTATVSMQYSYLPSWMSFLVDSQRAQSAGRLLFEAVYERIQQLPVDQRPLLVVSGESLGSFGGEAAFSGAQDLAERTDGALFVGPTGDNVLWSRFTAERKRGTPEILPVYDGGRTVRFGDRAEDFDKVGTAWEGPRVGYLQHPNDPITWWNWSLAVRRPDWLREPRGRGVLGQVRWLPLLTFLQVSADQGVANSVPEGEGHLFGQEPARAWAKILAPPGWTDADTDKVVEALRNLRVHDLS